MITESKLKNGTLTLGTSPAVPFACQATNVRLVPSANETGDEVETLCGDKIGAETKTSWTLAGTSIQDFTDADGFVLYCFEHDLEIVAYSWTPNPEGPTWSGTVEIRALEMGGDVNSRLTTDWEWKIKEDKPTMAPFVPEEP
jgi:hypothetical protein